MNITISHNLSIESQIPISKFILCTCISVWHLTILSIKEKSWYEKILLEELSSLMINWLICLHDILSIVISMRMFGMPKISYWIKDLKNLKIFNNKKIETNGVMGSMDRMVEISINLKNFILSIHPYRVMAIPMILQNMADLTKLIKLLYSPIIPLP